MVKLLLNEDNGKEKVHHISFGYMLVKLSGIDNQLQIPVIKGFGNKPMMPDTP